MHRKRHSRIGVAGAAADPTVADERTNESRYPNMQPLTTTPTNQKIVMAAAVSLFAIRVLFLRGIDSIAIKILGL